jgi:hypothetical protein
MLTSGTRPGKVIVWNTSASTMLLQWRTFTMQRYQYLKWVSFDATGNRLACSTASAAPAERLSFARGEVFIFDSEVEVDVDIILRR